MMTSDEKIRTVMGWIESELRLASSKFGEFASSHEGIAVIREEYLELEHEVFHGGARGMKTEAIQVGAMAARMLTDCILDGEGAGDG